MLARIKKGSAGTLLGLNSLLCYPFNIREISTEFYKNLPGVSDGEY